MVKRTRKSNLSGRVIDEQYRLTVSIGSGGMGEVWMATELKTGRWVAVKLLQKRLLENVRAVARFDREISIIKRLDHRNICPILDFGVWEDGVPYYVMPLLDGRSLADLLKRKRLDGAKICQIISQILMALEEAHRKNVIHRDLKPKNIFVIKEKTGIRTAKLLDFGVGKELDSESSKLTGTGVAVGTGHYMAPEQARGSKKIDQRVDIYGIGVVLYECFTGSRPYQDVSSDEVQKHLLACDIFEAPRSVDPSVPQEIETIILKAMSRDPQDRYQSATEMRLALESINFEDAEEDTALSRETSEWIPIPKKIKD